MLYFTKFPDLAKGWLVNGKKISQAKIRDELGLQIEKDTYALLSNFYAHPNESDSLIPIISGSGNTGEGFHPFLYFISNQCRLSIGCGISFAKDTIRLLLSVFSPQQLGDDGTWAMTVMQVLKTTDDCAIEIAQDLRKEFTD